MRRDTTEAVCPKSTTAAKLPSCAISESYWRGRTLYDISWQDFMRLPGVTKKMAAEVDEAAEAGWPGVSPGTRRFLFKHGIDRVRPL
jgi:hypothetical protein